jgi:hypothetical protein
MKGARSVSVGYLNVLTVLNQLAHNKQVNVAMQLL